MELIDPSELKPLVLYHQPSSESSDYQIHGMSDEDSLLHLDGNSVSSVQSDFKLGAAAGAKFMIEVRMTKEHHVETSRLRKWQRLCRRLGIMKKIHI